MAKEFQSVFDDAVEAEKEFDTMFGAEEDDHLIEAVLGFNEEGVALPSEEELHQTDDEATPDDIAKELGPDHDENKPTCDSSDQEIIAKDDDEALDLACPKFGVQDAVDKSDIDAEDITGEIDDVKDEFSEAYHDLLDEAETDLGDNDGLGEPGDLGEVDDMGQKSDSDELTDNEDKNEKEEMADPVDESTSLVDALLKEADEPTGEDIDKELPDDKSEVGSENDPKDAGEPDVNNDAKAGAEGTDKDPVYEDGCEGGKCDPAKTDAPKEEAEFSDKEIPDNDPEIAKQSEKQEGEVEESVSLVDALLESDDNADLPEKAEDQIVAVVDDEKEMTEDEVDAIDDVYDDDLLDDVAGED